MCDKQMKDIESLLKQAPDPPRLDHSRREVIWQNIEPALGPEEPRSAAERKATGTPDRRFRWLVWATAAAAVLILALILGRYVILPERPGPEEPAASIAFGEIQIARGRCTVTDPQGREQTVAAGQSVGVGDILSVGPTGGVRVRLHDQSEIWLCEGTQIECSHLRSDPGPTLRLVGGELRADVTASPAQLFAVETPTATLNVLGTQFNCQVFSNLGPKERLTMSTKNIMQRAFTVLTVLSGTVEVCGLNGPQTVHATQRSIVTSSTATVASVRNPQYTQQWLGEPGSRSGPTIPYCLPVALHVLQSLWVYDVEGQQSHHVTDFLGTPPRIVARVAADLALIKVGSLIQSHFGGGMGGSGKALVDDQVLLVNLRTGAKIVAPSLQGCDPLYLSMSPDRRKLAFVGSCGAGQESEQGVFVIDIESAEITKRLAGAIKTRPNWSPDSRWLVVSKAEGYVTDHPLVLIDTLTGEVVETGLKGAGAVFSPDGREIVYSSGFARGGSWYQGIPSTGNLFAAPLAGGPARQITFIKGGGAVLPDFSPDGSFIVYCEHRREKGRPRLTHHLLDAKTRQDQPICEAAISDAITWLDGGTSLAIAANTSAPKDKVAVRIVDIVNGRATVREVSAATGDLPDDLAQAGRQFAERLAVIGEALDTVRRAEDMHELERLVRTWPQIERSLIALADEVANDKDTQGPWQALALTKLDFAPYIAYCSGESGLSLEQRVDRIVERNLNAYIPSVLSFYCKEHSGLPSGLEALARWAPRGGRWQIDHIRGGDAEVIRRWFVVPGADPDQVVTSYTLVDSESGQGRWVIQSPRLPSGRIYKAVYNVERDGRGQFQIRHDVQAVE
ncbi:MAG: FecR domain-containing protein [Phycisphaerales bacterium]|nr:MAG: FecR domain-containing protein [Phycisphaerales bacterium]